MGSNYGFDPPNRPVVLVEGSDWNPPPIVLKVDGVETDWPVGTSILLTFDDPAVSDWSATVSGAEATFAIDKAVVATVANGTEVRYRYVNGTDDETFAIGKVAKR